MMFRTLCLSALFLFSLSLNAQLQGQLSNSKGEILPFANVYVKGTSKGTTSNIDGNYSLELDSGNYEIVFQYVGYEQLIKSVSIKDEPIILNAQLQELSISLGEITITAGEDPAYPVIRKAIAKRKFHRDQIKRYTCDVYIKGTQKIYAAPQKIMGVEIGDMGGSLDSTRQGIVYLSESVSKVNYEHPGKFQEEMISSKVSGNNNGFSFNQARAMNFSFYENYVDINRKIISPIASNALLYYKYQLEGVFYDKENRLINKIKVIPRRDTDPAFFGHLYIVEDLWNIHSTDLKLTRASSKIPVLDTLTIQQVHIPVSSDGVWRMISQTILLKISFLGIKTGGNFTGVYTNYNLDPPIITETLPKNKVLNVKEDANLKDSMYWSSIRPIPLTQEEASDYVKKDSLQEVWKSESYLDSVDTKNNKFKILNLLGGYTYNQSYEKKYWTINSPLTNIQFSTVQGVYFDLPIKFRREFDEYAMRWYEIKAGLNYGFSEKQLRWNTGFTYNFNRTNFARLSIDFGKTVNQFDEFQPISLSQNSLYSLGYRRNYAKFYEKEFAQLKYRQEITNGIFVLLSSEYANRNPLVNTTALSWSKRDDRVYSSNDPLNPENHGIPSFQSHKAWSFRADVRLRIGQKYMSYPGRKITLGSKYPDIWLSYKKGIKSLGSEVDYDYVQAQLRYRLELGLLGNSSFHIEAATFLNKKNVPFIDNRHFHGNQTILGTPSKYNRQFLLLPYYDYSTTNSNIQLHYQHEFNGAIMDKLPLLRKLDWRLVAGAKALIVEGEQPYFEIHAGLDNIGWSIFRLFRLDFVTSLREGEKLDAGLILGIKL